MAKIRVWNTKVGKHHYIHPDLAKDKTFMQQRGMILDPEIKAAPVAQTAPVPVFEPVTTPSPEPMPTPKPTSKSKTNAN